MPTIKTTSLKRVNVGVITLILSPLILLTIGCSNVTPDSLIISIPELIEGINPVSLNVSAINSEGEDVPIGEYKITAVPNSVGTIEDGYLKCIKTGELGITAVSFNVSTSKTIKCSVADRFEISETLSLIAKDPIIELPFYIYNHNGEAISRDRVKIESTNDMVLSVKGTKVKGNVTGIAALILKVDGVEEKVEVNVVNISKLEVPPVVFGILNAEKRFPISIIAYSIDGRQIHNVVPRLKVVDGDIIKVEGSDIFALKQGQTELEVSAGGESVTVIAASMEVLSEKTLRIPEGTQLVEIFESGSYFVIIKDAPINKTHYGLTAMWSGASCIGSKESQNISLICDVEKAATLIIQNPPSGRMGATITGTMKIIRFGLPIKKAMEGFSAISKIESNKKSK